MASVNLGALPSEVLQGIALYLYGSYRPSLSSFALVSKQCLAAASVFTFQDIQLRVWSRRQLRRDIKRWLQILSNRDATKHVRRLQLTGSLPLTEEADTKLGDEPYPIRNQCLWEELFGRGEDAVISTDGPIVVSAYENGAWQPVVNLLLAVPHLTDLSYGCKNQFPPCLLEALHTHQPWCRLEINTFRFRSLLQETTDVHEMAIATSPCLHSIKVQASYCDSDGRPDHNEAAILRLVAGLAPNLKKVVMITCRPACSLGMLDMQVFPQGPWGGFKHPAVTKTTEERGSLTSLAVHGYQGTDAGSLRAWGRATDFANLHHLNLASGIDQEAMEYVADARGSPLFPHLKHLEVRITTHSDRSPPPPGFSDSAVAFFLSLRPLEMLKLSGSLDHEILAAVISRHGSSLRKLQVRPSELATGHRFPMTLNKDDIVRIHTSCLLLEDLALPVQRTKSDATEVEMYKALGQCKALRTLFVELDCSMPWVVDYWSRDDADDLDDDEYGPPDDPTFDAYERQLFNPGGQFTPRRGHVRDALLSAAVDEALARSIWDVIVSAVPAGLRLQSLTLYTTGAGRPLGEGWKSDYDDIMSHIGRSYVLERTATAATTQGSSGADNNSVSIRELGRAEREKGIDDDHEKQAARELTSWARKEGSIWNIFRRVWPPKPGSRDWRDDWASLPLQADATSNLSNRLRIP